MEYKKIDRHYSKICKICGKEFESLYARATCCSDECRKESSRIASREWNRRHSAELAKKQRERRAEKNWFNSCFIKQEKEDRLAKIVKEHGSNYGEYQMKKTLEMVEPIDTDLSKFKSKGSDK